MDNLDRAADEDPMIAAANLLYQMLREEARLAMFFAPDNAEEVIPCLIRMLKTAFGETEWPSVQLSVQVIEGGNFDEFVQAILFALGQPLPLGEDAFTAALDYLVTETDDRVTRFLEYLAEAVNSLADEAENSIVSDESSGSLGNVESNGDKGENPESQQQEGAGVDLPDDSQLDADEIAAAQQDALDSEINVQTFDELVMEASKVKEVQNAWNMYLGAATSREAAGEAIYAALFDSAPSLQSLFKTPRAVMAMRFMNGLGQIILAMSDVKLLKITVETLGFQHLDLEVTVPRVVIFRDAIIDLLQLELGSRFNSTAHSGWATILNYVGGAYIYVRLKYADRLKIIASSWATANNSSKEDLDDDEEETGAEEKAEEARKEKEEKTDEDQRQTAENIAMMLGQQTDKKKPPTSKTGFFSRFRPSMAKGAMTGGRLGATADSNAEEKEDESGFKNTNVPTTYHDMFRFNAAVMGFNATTWMSEVLLSFDCIVRNCSNSYRLQEECDVLSLRIAKHKGPMNLPEYKAIMLASLRSVVPKDWNSAHEVAWSWLWENVERMLKALVGKPNAQNKALEKLYKGMSEQQLVLFRREVYVKFFTLAPAGQDFFKQSTTRLHFIADRIIAMTLEIYKDPKKMVEDISALGLRHVGYGIPTELFGPFVTACIDVVRTLTKDPVAEEAFRWSLGLISRILVRTINEGSTIVMKAINTNSAKQLKKAISCAPRGKRSQWMLSIQVGTQSISPLMWAIQSGSLEAAKAMISDLLVIRADRDRYYYGMDDLFERHTDIIYRLSLDAPALLTTLLDGLIWRSRVTDKGMRRVNYYIKHLLLDANSNFSPALSAINKAKDPKLLCHPCLVLVADTVWSGVAYRTFIYSKSWLLFTLVVFVTSQSILSRVDSDSEAQRIGIFACRTFIYALSMGSLVYSHSRKMWRNFRQKDFFTVFLVPIPKYLSDWQELTSLALMVVLLCMFALEPISRCLDDMNHGGLQSGLFTQTCSSGQAVQFSYSTFSMLAMLLYYILLIDLTVFSTRISAFALVCGYVLSEVFLFLLALVFCLLMFSASVSSLKHQEHDLNQMHVAGLTLFRMAVRMYQTSKYDALKAEPWLLLGILCFFVVTGFFLLNLLIAQLNSSYQSIYADMVGFARLNRAEIICETMPTVSKTRWQRFVHTLHLDQRLEFNEGDVGLAGGLQVFEPAAANPTTKDMIRRFGGSTSPKMQWPEDDEDLSEDRFDKLEKMILKAMKRMKESKAEGGSKSGSKLGSSHSAGQEGSSDHLSEAGNSD